MPWAKGEDFIDLKERFRELQIEEKPTITALHIPKSDLIELLKSFGSRPFTYSTTWMKGKE